MKVRRNVGEFPWARTFALGGTTMFEKTLETVDNGKGRFEDVLENKFAAVALDVDLLKKKVEYAVEGAVIDAQRLAKRGRHTMEDMVDDTAYFIKKEPFKSVGIAAIAGLGLGVFTGWLISRKPGNNIH